MSGAGAATTPWLFLFGVEADGGWGASAAATAVHALDVAAHRWRRVGAAPLKGRFLFSVAGVGDDEVGGDGELGPQVLVEVEGRARRRPRRVQRRLGVENGPRRGRGGRRGRAEGAAEGRRGGAGEASKHFGMEAERRGGGFCAACPCRGDVRDLRCGAVWRGGEMIVEGGGKGEQGFKGGGRPKKKVNLGESNILFFCARWLLLQLQVNISWTNIWTNMFPVNKRPFL